ncbi:MAG TPA: response regulator, partial [Cyclobacteriaceae bacterium]|nr:response regulator [Cyclobacteriaceae bacterium]
MQPKILLVDDREDNLLSIETILEPGGYKFVKASSGRQALKILLTEFDFAMILMDVKMPNLNGFETASLIYEREKLRHIPIIFITANNYGDENMFKGYQSGAIDYIFKPINPEVLRAKVGVLIDLYKKNRLLYEQEQKLIAINKSLELEVNERKASEEKVKQLNRKLLENIAHLETANKDLERFAFMASHDLQEPLRKIRMFSDMLYTKHKDVLQEDVKMITRINTAADRMRALIVDILAFSKVSTEKSEFVHSDVNVLLKELLADMEEEVKEKKATITVEHIPELVVSPRLIRPLFQNLINNALKYRKKNVDPKINIRSEISLAISDRDNRNLVNKYCRIFVEDNGIGFDQKYAEEIFGMFKRLHHHGEFEGTGVGLALCKKITELHSGFISARSKVNEGTTFIISLP